MKKRILSLILVAALLFLLVSCGSGASLPKGSKGRGAELALITDCGTIDDRSFNQSSWEGMAQYAMDHDKTFKYYEPTEKSEEAMMTSIGLAVKGGAKVIVCSGFLFDGPVYVCEQKYPDVNFLVLDTSPKNVDTEEELITPNTSCIYYAEEQAGFLAGYAAVKEGYRSLGFMGGIAVPAVIRYGYGFIQGADYAARELNLGQNRIKINYTYVGNFDASPENMTKAASWYRSGTEVIFACGGAVGNSVMKAAETTGGKVIGVDVDQSAESPSVITSAMKSIRQSVYESLDEMYHGKFQGGTSRVLDASMDGVELPLDSSRFEHFTKADYDRIFQKLKANEISVKRDTEVASAADLGSDLVTVRVL